MIFTCSTMVYTSAQVDWKFDLWNRFLPSSMHPKSLILALYSLNTHTQEPASSLEYEFGNIGNYFFLCDFLSKKRSYLWRYKGSYFRKLIRKRQGWTTTKTENKKKTFRTDKTPNQKIFPPIKWRRNYIIQITLGPCHVSLQVTMIWIRTRNLPLNKMVL